MQIISRRDWGARHAAAWRNLDAPLPARELYLHHSVTVAPDLLPPFDDDDAAVRTLERIGQQRFGWGISYTFVVTPAGRVYEGHRLDGVGAHTAKRNSIARAICLVGNYDTARPSEQMLNATADLVAHGHRQGWWPAQLTGGHRDAPGASTACPGRQAYSLVPVINNRALTGGTMSWDTPSIPDYYRPPGAGPAFEQLVDLPSPRIALAWATAHAAHARDWARDAAVTLARVEAKLDQLASQRPDDSSLAGLTATLDDLSRRVLAIENRLATF